MSQSSRYFVFLALAGFSTSIFGCSPSQEVKTIPITGKVLVKGKPAAYATLMFHPVIEDPREFLVSATADENGEFELIARQSRDGDQAVAYEITISWRIPKNPTSKSDPEYGPQLLPPKYQDPKNSGLKAEIDSSVTELPPFELNP